MLGQLAGHQFAWMLGVSEHTPGIEDLAQRRANCSIRHDETLCVLVADVLKAIACCRCMRLP